jgi:osmotically-inducible protein OsmY
LRKTILLSIALLWAAAPIVQAQHAPNRGMRRDEKIREAVGRILSGHSEYKSVKADIDGAVVTLTGSVELASTRQHLVERIRRLSLVEDVENKLALDPPPPPDKELYNRVQRILQDAGFGTVKINVRDGAVTLEGMVGNEEQRERVLDVVRRTEGVKEVESRLTWATQ